MAQLVKDYNFGFPLKNVQQLDAIEQNILTDDKYASSLVNYQKTNFHPLIIIVKKKFQEKNNNNFFPTKIDEDNDENMIFFRFCHQLFDSILT